jgi:hypothetical protein
VPRMQVQLGALDTAQVIDGEFDEAQVSTISRGAAQTRLP